MGSKLTMKPGKASTLLITNYSDPKQDERKKEYSDKFMKNYMARSIRETRYFETIQNMSTPGKQFPLTLGSRSYDELFKKLTESCRSFFTKEYGKNEDDYNTFVENCTQCYETPNQLDDLLVRDRMRLFRYDKEQERRKKTSRSMMKKSKISIFSRHKMRGDHSKSRSRLQQSSIKRTKSLSRRTKLKSKRGEGYGVVFERSISDLVDSSEDDVNSEASKEFPKKVKPFVYKLSDPEMIRRGITVSHLPPVRLVTFFAYPVSYVSFWFQPRHGTLVHRYPNGQVSWKHEPVGVGAVYYDNGEAAISFTFGRITPLIIVYSKSIKIRDKTIKQVPVAIFDTKGNGIVYDKKTGKKRLIYDQAQGIYIDSPSKYPLPWKWKSYDRVMCQRAELNFRNPTVLEDFDYSRMRAHAKTKESSQRKLKTKGVSSITKKKKVKKKSVRSYLQRFKNKSGSKVVSPKSASNATFGKSSRLNNIIRDIDLPKVLRFVDSGIVIEPILTPCAEMDLPNANIVALCLPDSNAPFDSRTTSRNLSQLEIASNSRSGSKGRSKGSKGLNRLDELILREPLTGCKDVKENLCLLKPIVLNLTDNVSLTITEQEHIHIDFISPPQHYSFSIGVKIDTTMVDSIFDVRIPKVDKDYFPSCLEALKMKCPMLYNVNHAITNLRQNVLQKSRRDCIKRLKSWGQDKYLGKVPLCKLMNNKCRCRDCYCNPNFLKVN